MKHFKLWVLVGLLFCLQPILAQTPSVTAIHDLLNRIGGAGTADRFVVKVDATGFAKGEEAFVIKAEGGKPCIVGSTPSAVTTGINWYLNHNAKVNLTWNQLTTDLSGVALPAPNGEEKHTCNADYRYYLNYCTFSYSMSTWTWERWQQEIDWMALHGINMPLQIVGLDVVWQKLLTQDLGYSEKEANDFIAGPCFQAWWGMNNLEGWGGPNPQWWYDRQESLAKKILARQRELGMQPVLPGYSGMVPSNIGQKKGYNANNQGHWCSFLRPYILDPNSPAFAEVSALYYKRLNEVMGTSEYYSMDPFHEGANTEGIDVRSAYSKIAKAMTDANKDGKWVIQFWQWNGAQYNVLDMVKKKKLIVLDLFSDAHTHFGDYRGHDAVYCALPNFGGRTGLFGRLSKIMKHYFEQKAAFGNIKGIGATPEAIEQAPIIYDALFELAWRNQAPDPQKWVEEYAVNRYGQTNVQAQQAWEKVRNTALNCETSLQGPHEAVLCARPAYEVGSVSFWGGAEIFYDAQEMVDAAFLLLQAKNELSGKNYSYDLTDFTRQALTDYGNYLLKSIKKAKDKGDSKAYAQRRDTYLQLILDVDRLLNTNENFMLGRWTQMARAIADEVEGTTTKDKEWLELNNARTLITTWGAKENSEWGGLRDYSYREWGGMMKDFYYQRWATFFKNADAGKGQPDWFQNDWNWAHNAQLSYSTEPVGNTAEVAEELFNKYFLNIQANDHRVYHAYRCMESDGGQLMQASAVRGESYTFPVIGLAQNEKVKVGIDFNNDNNFSADEMAETLTVQIPADAVAGNVIAQVALTDGTLFRFRLTLRDEIKAARTVSVKSANERQGKVKIVGSDQLSVNNKEQVTLQAIPVSGYNFAQWTDAAGKTISTENPYTYLGAAAAEFTAHFTRNKWGTPQEDKKEWSTIESYGQYLTFIGVIQNNSAEQTVYTANACPEQLCQTTQLFQVAQGSEFKIHWKDKGGMNYCRLSAYIDLNGDGDFIDEGEFLTVLGNKSNAGNTMLNEHTLKVLLPYEIPEGITHVRLRFDGAWQTSNLNSFDAVPAKATTLRMVYDLPIQVSKMATTACTVTVKSENKNLGTVDANGQPDTYTYGVGEEVVLRCYPAEGYFLTHWTDKYGRAVPKSWMQANFLRFHAPESGTYTAHFSNTRPGSVTFGDWEFEAEEKDNQLRLLKVNQAGQGVLDLTSGKKAVIGVSPQLFHGQTTLSKVIFPASLMELDNLGAQLSLTGSNEAATENLPTPIQGNRGWTLFATVKNNGQSFNQWGSSLLATGNDPFANAYDNGFQLYLKADKQLIVKIGSSENVIKDVVGNFSVRIDYDGKESFHVTLTKSNQQTETLALKHHLNDISALSYGLPQGLNLERVGIYYHQFSGNPFEGCKSLTDIQVAAGNLLFADNQGVLLNEQRSEVLAYPMGRLYQKVFTLQNKATLQWMTATPPADPQGALIATNENGNDRQVQTAAEVALSSLWKFAEMEGKAKLYHYNSKGYLGGKSGNGGEGQVLEILSNPQWAGNYVLQWKAAFTPDLQAIVALKLQNENLSLSSQDNLVKLAKQDLSAENTLWVLREVSTVSLSTTASAWTSVAFPVAIEVPEAQQGEVFQVNGKKGQQLSVAPIAEGTVLAAGEGLLLQPTHETMTFAIAQAPATALPHNLLLGATARRTGFTVKSFYLLSLLNDSYAMQLSPLTTTADNCAYLPVDTEGTPDEVLSLQLNTGIDGLETDEVPQQIYDLQGRRLHQITGAGIYIVNGKKCYVK